MAEQVQQQKAKRPITGFQMYLREFREKMKKESPKLVMAEFMKQASMNWTRMTNADKKRYEMMVAKDRVRVEQQLLDMKRQIEAPADDADSPLASNFSESYSEIDRGFVLNKEEMQSQLSSLTEKSLNRIAKFDKIRPSRDGFASKAQAAKRRVEGAERLGNSQDSDVDVDEE